jgi:hypothetical protein
MKRKAYSRGERKEMILDILYSMIGDQKEPYMTAYEMAKALGLNSPQHIRGIMEEMVSDGHLSYIQVKHRDGIYKRIYCPAALIPFEDVPKRPEPQIRFHGKVVK